MTNQPDRPFLSSRALYALLAVSIASNIVMAVRLKPGVIDRMLVRMQAPPVVESTDHVRGRANAKSTVIVFMDYQCPYCANLHSAMLALSRETDVRWVYRHFPLEFHPHAEQAAEAAECGGAQGKFWEYSDALFDPGFNIEADSSFSRLASAIGLNSKAFDRCLSSGQFAARVSAQRRDGVRRRIAGTPTFFVNGRRIAGVIPLDEFREALAK